MGNGALARWGQARGYWSVEGANELEGPHRGIVGLVAAIGLNLLGYSPSGSAVAGGLLYGPQSYARQRESHDGHHGESN
jgi:hypothetical protein